MAAAEKDPTPDRKRPCLSSSLHLLPPASSTSHFSFTSSTSWARHDWVCRHSFWSGTKYLFWYRAGFSLNYEKPSGVTRIDTTCSKSLRWHRLDVTVLRPGIGFGAGVLLDPSENLYIIGRSSRLGHSQASSLSQTPVKGRRARTRRAIKSWTARIQRAFKGLPSRAVQQYQSPSRAD